MTIISIPRNKAKFDGDWSLNRIVGKILECQRPSNHSFLLGLAMTDGRAKTRSATPKVCLCLSVVWTKSWRFIDDDKVDDQISFDLRTHPVRWLNEQNC
jgi:hypothetical protein